MRAGTDASQNVRRVSTSRGGERADTSPLETAWCRQGCEVAGHAGLSLASSRAMDSGPRRRAQVSTCGETLCRAGKAKGHREGGLLEFGAGEESRTPDLRITNALLYQLSYTGLVLSLRF